MPVSTSPAQHSSAEEIVPATQTTSVVYSVAHAVPGRVGFCVPRISFDSKYEHRLQVLLALQDWVTSQEVNKNAGSIVVSYNMGVMSDAEMRSQLVNLIQRAGEVQVVTQQVSEIVDDSLTQINLQSTTNEEACAHNAIDIVEVQNTPVSSSPSESAIKHQTQPAKVAYSIVHVMPGRVRFRIPRIASDPKYVQSLEALLKADSAVTSERVNSAAASIVITYKTGLMQDSQKQSESVFQKVISHLDGLIQSASCIIPFLCEVALNNPS